MHVGLLMSVTPLRQCKLAVAADRVDDAAGHYRALMELDAESPASMEVLASLASAFGRQREQGAEVHFLSPGKAAGSVVLCMAITRVLARRWRMPMCAPHVHPIAHAVATANCHI